MVVLGLEPESLVLGAIDPKPETVALELEVVVPESEVAVHYDYKDSGTRDVAKVHTCGH